MNNLAPGVSIRDPHFDTPLCPCGHDAPLEGESCDNPHCDLVLTADGYVEADELAE